MKDKEIIEGFLEDEELSLEEKEGWRDIYVDHFGPIETSGLSRVTIKTLIKTGDQE
jgi:hypothetical protein